MSGQWLAVVCPTIEGRIEDARPAHDSGKPVPSFFSVWGDRSRRAGVSRSKVVYLSIFPDWRRRQTPCPAMWHGVGKAPSPRRQAGSTGKYFVVDAPGFIEVLLRLITTPNSSPVPGQARSQGDDAVEGSADSSARDGLA